MAISPAGAIATAWTLFTISLLPFLARLYTRLRHHNRTLSLSLSLSDVFLSFSLLFFFLSSITDILLYKHNLFQRSLTISVGKTPDFPDGVDVDEEGLKLLYWTPIPYYLCLYSVKGSLVLLYLSIFPKWREIRHATYATGSLSIVGVIITVCITLGWCGPARNNWAPTPLPSPKCMSATSPQPYFTAMAFHVITDLLLYILPLFVLPCASLSACTRNGVILLYVLATTSIALLIARIALVGKGSTVMALAAVGSGELCTAAIVGCLSGLNTSSWRNRGSEEEREGSKHDDSQRESPHPTTTTAPRRRRVKFSWLDPLQPLELEEETGVDVDAMSEPQVEEVVTARVVRAENVFVRRSRTSRDMEGIVLDAAAMVRVSEGCRKGSEEEAEKRGSGEGGRRGSAEDKVEVDEKRGSRGDVRTEKEEEAVDEKTVEKQGEAKARTSETVMERGNAGGSDSGSETERRSEDSGSVTVTRTITRGSDDHRIAESGSEVELRG